MFRSQNFQPPSTFGETHHLSTPDPARDGAVPQSQPASSAAVRTTGKAARSTTTLRDVDRCRVRPTDLIAHPGVGRATAAVCAEAGYDVVGLPRLRVERAKRAGSPDVRDTVGAPGEAS